MVKVSSLFESELACETLPVKVLMLVSMVWRGANVSLRLAMGGSWDICQGLRHRHTLVEVVDRGVERIRLRANGREVRFDRCEVTFG